MGDRKRLNGEEKQEKFNLVPKWLTGEKKKNGKNNEFILNTDERQWMCLNTGVRSWKWYLRVLI